jgi:hypothetical protein
MLDAKQERWVLVLAACLYRAGLSEDPKRRLTIQPVARRKPLLNTTGPFHSVHVMGIDTRHERWDLGLLPPLSLACWVCCQLTPGLLQPSCIAPGHCKSAIGALDLKPVSGDETRLAFSCAAAEVWIAILLVSDFFVIPFFGLIHF